MRRLNSIARRRLVSQWRSALPAPGHDRPIRGSAYQGVTAGERRAADLFWADLVGGAARQAPRVSAASARALSGHDDGISRGEMAFANRHVPGESAAETTGTLVAEAAPRGAPVVVAAPRPRRPAYSGALIRQDGIDVYQENDIPAWNDIRGAGIGFVIHRASIGGTLDTEFAARYAGTRANGLIRGSYHYYLHRDGVGGEVQGNRLAGAVERLGPGELAPSLDFEEAAVAKGSTEPPTAAAWRTELEAFLDAVETRLGRTPLIYTRRSAWNAHVGGRPDFRPADFSHFGDYPLWVLHYAVAFHPTPLTVTDAKGQQTAITVNFNADRNPKRSDAVFPPGAIGDQLFALARNEFRKQAWEEGDRLYLRRQRINPPATAIPGPWTTWSLFQYSPFTPGAMRAHGFATDYKVDFNVTRGGVYFLRGLADLGHTAPHLVGNQHCIAYTEPNGEIHLLEYVSGSWVDQDIARDMPRAADVGTLPAAVGDPATAVLGTEEIIVYRSAGGRVHALTRNITATDSRWRAADITGATAFDDPFVVTLQNTIHVVYRDESDALVHLTRVNGAWRAESLADRAAGAHMPSRISGSAAAYPFQNALHVVSRSRDAGHLFDFVTPAGAAPQDLTAASHGPDGQTPAATYRPAVYTRTGQAPRIVFRALRGHIWQIERDTLNARDLSAAAAAPTAAGNPTAVAADTAHILFRGVDGAVHEIFDDNGVWRSRRVCADATAASDPTAYIDERGHAAATFRTLNGPIHLVRLVKGRWVCEDT